MPVNVLLLILGGFPARHVSEKVTPTLWQLASSGGWAPDGGEAVMTSASYPNCATFATGATPNRHRVLANRVPTSINTVAGAWEIGPALPTLFDACRDAGRTTGVVVADPHLIGVLGAQQADIRWPATVDEPSVPDDEVVDTLMTLFNDPPDLTIAHLEGPSRAAHAFGPDSPAARDRYHETDALLRPLFGVLQRRWHDVAVIVVSDHDVEATTSADPIDLEAAVRRYGLRLTVVPEGGAALVMGTDNQQGRWLADATGVAGTIELSPDLRLVWARPGRLFGPNESAAPLGIHGGPGTTAQLAIVGGGHPAVAAITAMLGRRTPRASDWAPTIADLLALDLPTATGRSMLAATPATSRAAS